MIDFAKLIEGIEPLDENAIMQAREHFDQLIKPKGSLAKLEDMVCLYVGATGVFDAKKIQYPRKAIMLWADSQADEAFLRNLKAGKEPITILARKAKSEVVISELCCNKTNLTSEALIDALLAGAARTEEYIVENGYKLLSVAVPGRYSLPENWLNFKDEDAFTNLLHLNDVRVAAAVGTILCAAYLKTPIMLDGLASVVAAFLAAKISPFALKYCIASHITTEEGQEFLLKSLGLSAVLRLKITQGQGEGSAIAFTLFDAGIRAYKEMETFAEAGVHAEVSEFAQTKTK